ncbi:MAG TPA: 16S rRNA (cytosine(1402)-N(4))-methyltransferase RsmH [Phnomibacter sp.]|nr:16S rRNA (cytosine(1402)-N(4))-methyltransferase RsmH [Phnomibacter sp.]
MSGTQALHHLPYHVPIMVPQVLEGLHILPQGTYVDCTMGGGGHSRAILENLGAGGKLVAFDQDADAAAQMPADDRLLFVPENFRHLQRFLRLHGIGQVDGVLADLGVSSHQFDEGERGFSYRFDAVLDMRMNQRQPLTAAEVVNTYTAAQLQQCLSAYGEVTNARTLAAALVQQRQAQPFKTIADLLQVLKPLAKGKPNRYYAQVFQALRIEVNDEMGALKDLLEQLPKVLKPGGRVAIITFHSVEDRLVKNWLKQPSENTAPDPIYGGRPQSPFELITRKPIEPDETEIKMNPRAASARLRIAALKANG